jgi:transcriptional regulator with XRE-family HTH domain
MFGDLLKQVRTSKKISQVQLAESINVRQKDISRWECGEREPSLCNLRKLCKALNVSADVLLEL